MQRKELSERKLEGIRVLLGQHGGSGVSKNK